LTFSIWVTKDNEDPKLLVNGDFFEASARAELAGFVDRYSKAYPGSILEWELWDNSQVIEHGKITFARAKTTTYG